MAKVAIITGGASGIGLSVANALASRDGESWHVHIVDRNLDAGRAAVSSLQRATFHECDIGDYAVLSQVFHSVYASHSRLDFVFANAGIIETSQFYEQHDVTDRPPPPLNHGTIEINLKATIDTGYLALSYFRRNKKDEVTDPNLVMTASMAGLYSIWPAPLYSPAKHGVVSFVRAVAPKLQQEGIRINAVCPGAVVTNLLPPTAWAAFPPELITPVESVRDVVLMFVDGKDTTDARNAPIAGRELFGKVVEVSRDKFYFVNEPESVDEVSEKVNRIVGGIGKSEWKTN